MFGASLVRCASVRAASLLITTARLVIYLRD
jgi:hypothetical protein